MNPRTGRERAFARVSMRAAWDALATTIVALAAVTMLLLYLHDRKRLADCEPRAAEELVLQALDPAM